MNRIRGAVLKGEKTTEVSFNAYCDVSKLSQDTRQELARARVIVRDVPSQKPAASDIRLLQDMLHHTMTHRTGIIVLISGDIDFAETVHDLVHTGGYKVIVIHNKQARPELCKNASSALRFEDVVGGGGGDSEKGKKEGNGKPKNSNSGTDSGKSGVSGKGKKEGDNARVKNDNSKQKKGAVEVEGKNSSSGKKHDVGGKGGSKKTTSAARKQTWPCESCGKRFVSQEARDNHVDATGHSIQWICEECTKSFSTEKGLEQHQEATGHDQICCEDCGNRFNSLRSLSQHLDATGHGAHLCWSCPHCHNETWDRLKELLDHLRLDH